MKQRQAIQTFHHRQSCPSTVELGNTRFKPMSNEYIGTLQKYS